MPPGETASGRAARYVASLPGLAMIRQVQRFRISWAEWLQMRVDADDMNKTLTIDTQRKAMSDERLGKRRTSDTQSAHEPTGKR